MEADAAVRDSNMLPPNLKKIGLESRSSLVGQTPRSAAGPLAGFLLPAANFSTPVPRPKGVHP
jgi:hypothetical protein